MQGKQLYQPGGFVPFFLFFRHDILGHSTKREQKRMVDGLFSIICLTFAGSMDFPLFL